MERHQIEIDLTRLKEIVGKYWNHENKDKYFRSYEDKEGKKHDLLIADLNVTEPQFVKKADGTKVESQTAVLHSTGFAQVSEKVGEEWTNENFANLKRWIDKVDTTPPAQATPMETSSGDIDVDSIPF